MPTYLLFNKPNYTIFTMTKNLSFNKTNYNKSAYNTQQYGTNDYSIFIISKYPLFIKKTSYFLKTIYLDIINIVE